jgi:hypothetical protein
MAHPPSKMLLLSCLEHACFPTTTPRTPNHCLVTGSDLSQTSYLSCGGDISGYGRPLTF